MRERASSESPRLTADERNALVLRAEEARQRARAAAGRCARLLEDSEKHILDATRIREELAGVRVQLEESVRTYAQLLRRVDLPPERALVLVKDVVSLEIISAGSERRALTEAVTRWCIAAYYAA